MRFRQVIAHYVGVLNRKHNPHHALKNLSHTIITRIRLGKIFPKNDQTKYQLVRKKTTNFVLLRD